MPAITENKHENPQIGNSRYTFVKSVISFSIILQNITPINKYTFSQLDLNLLQKVYSKYISLLSTEVQSY